MGWREPSNTAATSTHRDVHLDAAPIKQAFQRRVRVAMMGARLPAKLTKATGSRSRTGCPFDQVPCVLEAAPLR